MEVYLIGYQSLRKLDCLQIIRKTLFSIKNTNLKNDNIIRDLRKGLISERKLPRVKIFNTITQLDERDSLSSLFTQNIYNDFLSCATIHLLYPPHKTLRHCRIFYGTYGNAVISNLNDFKNAPEYITEESSSW